MVAFPTIVKSIGDQCLKIAKPYSSRLLSHLNSNHDISRSHQWQFQTTRTLLIKSASEVVKLRRLLDSDSGIVEVSMDRPEVKNAIGVNLLRGLRESFEEINMDSSAKVLMLCSSVPKIFCAGADLKERKSMSPSDAAAFIKSLNSTFTFLEELQIPTIAVIEGAALGGGLEMALSCDLRICGEDAKLGLPETGLAIIPGAGGTQRLPRLVGISVAKELIFTGKKISGKDANSIGLANYCVPSGEAHSKALEIARSINEKDRTTRFVENPSIINCFFVVLDNEGSFLKGKLGPLALRMAKSAIDKGVEMSKESGLEWEEECYQQLMHTKDRLEGLAAFAEKRKPNYTGQ